MEKMLCMLVQCRDLNEVFTNLSQGFSFEFDNTQNHFGLSAGTLDTDISIFAKEMGKEAEEFIKKQINVIAGNLYNAEGDSDIKINLFHQIRKSNCLVFINYAYENEEDEGLIYSNIFKSMQKFRNNSVLLLTDGGRTVADCFNKVLLSYEHESEVQSFFPYFEEVQFPEDLTKEKIERRNKSLQALKEKNIYVTEYLPLIEDSRDCHVRSTEEIARRAAALLTVAVFSETILAEGQSPKEAREFVKALIERYDVEKYFSPKEKAYINNDNSSKEEQIGYSWQYENAYVMEWALGLVDVLPFPEAICDVSKTVGGFIEYGSIEEIVNASKKRSDSELLDEADFIYRADWACVDARVSGMEAPGGLESGVVMERHKALNWIIGADNAEWDNVDLST